MFSRLIPMALTSDPDAPQTRISNQSFDCSPQISNLFPKATRFHLPLSQWAASLPQLLRQETCGSCFLLPSPLHPNPLSNWAAKLTNLISKIFQMHPFCLHCHYSGTSHQTFSPELLLEPPLISYLKLWWLPRGSRIKFKSDLPFLPLQCPRLGHSSVITTVHHSGLILALWAD